MPARRAAEQLVLIGYLPKCFVAATGEDDAPAYPGVDEICSVSECFSKSPPDSVNHWRHNTETWLFDSAGAARSVVPEAERDRFRLYAYRLLPTLFHASGAETDHPLPELHALPLPDDFTRLGYDAVVRDPGAMDTGGNVPSFFCSPLSCNYMAEEYPVNRYCLVDDLDTALAMARDFANGNCEPGPYCVVEVWRRSA